MRSALFGIALVLASWPVSASALDKVTLGLNWFADPEAGGYYQALTDGTYAKYGLDVTIRVEKNPSDTEGHTEGYGLSIPALDSSAGKVAVH